MNRISSALDLSGALLFAALAIVALFAWSWLTVAGFTIGALAFILSLMIGNSRASGYPVPPIAILILGALSLASAAFLALAFAVWMGWI